MSILAELPLSELRPDKPPSPHRALGDLSGRMSERRQSISDAISRQPRPTDGREQKALLKLCTLTLFAGGVLGPASPSPLPSPSPTPSPKLLKLFPGSLTY